MITVDHQSEEYRELSDYLKNSSGSTHHINYKVWNRPENHSFSSHGSSNTWTL